MSPKAENLNFRETLTRLSEILGKEIEVRFSHGTGESTIVAKGELYGGEQLSPEDAAEDDEVVYFKLEHGTFMLRRPDFVESEVIAGHVLRIEQVTGTLWISLAAD